MNKSLAVRIPVTLLVILALPCILPPSYSHAQNDFQPEPSMLEGAVSSRRQLGHEKTESAKSRPNAKAENELTRKDPQYWMDKGGLYLTYGNADAAVRSFQKALALDPDNHGAMFNTGLALAEKGNYEKALAFIRRAVSVCPENGNYIYGLGWVHLLAGNKEKAMKAINKAAELGNPDAIEYLESIAPRRGENSSG